MRRIYIFSWLLALLCLSPNVKGQKVDTSLDDVFSKENSKVKINLGEGNYLLFSKKTFDMYNILKKSTNVQENIQEIQRYLSILQDSLEKYKSYEINYQTQQAGGKPSLSIKPLELNLEYYQMDNQQVQKSKTTQDKIHIIDDNLNYDVYLFVNKLSDIDDISSQNINEYINLIVKDIDESLKKRWYKSNILDLMYDVRDNTVQRIENNKPPLAYISLNLGLGLNVIRDRFVPESSLHLKTVFRNTWHIGASFTSHYLFERNLEGNYKTLSNHFAGLNFGFDPVGKYGEKGKYYVGLGVEYLIKRDGDFYQPETFKLSLDLKLSEKDFILSPQIFLGKGDNFIGFQIGRVF